PTLAHVIRFVHERSPKSASQSAPLVPAPVAETPPASPPAPAAASMPATDTIREKVLQIAAEKTGYPKDMLDLDLDLEADLGVDTVNQAEMFAAVRAAFDIPRDANLKLRDFPTLGHVIRFARDRQPAVAQPPATAPSSTPSPLPAAPPSPTTADPIVEKVLA